MEVNSLETTTMFNREWRTFQPLKCPRSEPMPDEEHVPKHKRFEYPEGGEVWKEWPEFQALMDRLGVDTEEVPTTNIIVEFPCDSLVKVTQVFHGMDTTKERKYDSKERTDGSVEV